MNIIRNDQADYRQFNELKTGELYYLEPCVRVRVVDADLVIK